MGSRQVAVTLILLSCLGASLGSRPSSGSFPEGAYALANSTSGMQEEVENFLADIAAHREDAGNVAALQGDERLQLKNQLNDAYWEVVGIENNDPTVIAARAKAEADQKAAADADQKKREQLARTVGAIFVAMFLVWIIILVLMCCNKRQIARRQQEHAAAQAALGGQPGRVQAAASTTQPCERQAPAHNLPGRMAAMDKSRSGIQPDAMFVCPITHDVMRDPVMAADGFTYERQVLEVWLLSHNTIPITNDPLLHKDLNSNHSLRSAIMEWQAKQGAAA